MYLWSRTMLFADCAVIRPPPGERSCARRRDLGWPPRCTSGTELAAAAPARRAVLGPDQPARAELRAAGRRRAAGRLPDRGRARLRAELLLGPAGPPDAGIVDRYQFADAATAWVPADHAHPGRRDGGRGPGRLQRGRPAPTRAVQPYASWLVTYQRYVYLRGTLLGVILLAAAGRRWRCGGGSGGRRAAVGVRGDDPAGAAADRRLRPALPGARGARRLPGRGAGVRPAAGRAGQRRWTTSPAATATSDSPRTGSTGPAACRQSRRRRPARRAADRRGVRPGACGRSWRTAGCTRRAARCGPDRRRPAPGPVPALELRPGSRAAAARGPARSRRAARRDVAGSAPGLAAGNRPVRWTR